MEKQQKKRIRRYISWALIAAIVVLLAILPMTVASEEADSSPRASVLSDTAAPRDISIQVRGGGTLTAEEAVEITIPAAVRLTGYLVENGELVTAGQKIAAVDRVSVMTAITQVQETMDYLAEEINSISGEEAADEVTATAGGTVKIIYAEEGESVQDVLLEHGALAVLSLDGLMSVTVRRSTALSGGDTVCVILPDGTEADGRVESNLDGFLTVTVEDNGYAVGAEVTVKTEDGDRIGSGTLSIHSQWNVVAYSGTVSRIRISEGDTVSAGKTLFDLDDTGHTAEFEILTRQHREYEKLMLEPFRMYQSESITAPCAGMVTGVDENTAYVLSDNADGWTVSLLANAPNGDDESGYVNYIGQVVEIGIDGLILRMNPQPLSITDYKDLSGVPADPALMTEEVVYTAGAAVYELSGGEWIQISTEAITAGDILLFAGDSSGSLVWVVRVAGGALLPEKPEATEPSKPEDSPESTEPSDPAAPTEPTAPETEAGISQGGGSMSGMGSAMEQEETAGLYGLDTVTVASVTPQQTMTVQITVDELDISHIHMGQSAAVTVDALSGGTFTAEVTGISASGENEGGSSKFTVELTMEKHPDMLAGMRASVSLTVQQVQAVVSVPVAALVEEGSGTLLYTGFDEETQEYTSPVTVTVGASDGEYAQILSGISEGQTVYYPYYDTLIISDVPDMARGFPFG